MDKPFSEPPDGGHGEPRTLVCGVDKELVEQFLDLIRNYYKKADKATFFLELRTGLVNVPGITNIRDVLSHLVTLLDSSTPQAERRAQIENAAEHLRRAIIEPYEMGFNDLTVRFNELYKAYKRHVIPVKDDHVVLKSAPNAVSIEARLRSIESQAGAGRAAKATNFWNSDWEAGVTNFVNAYEDLSVLNNELETYYYKLEQILGKNQQIDLNNRQIAQNEQIITQEKSEFKWSTLLHFTGHAIGILAIIIAVILVLKPSWVEAIRAYFHMAP